MSALDIDKPNYLIFSRDALIAARTSSRGDLFKPLQGSLGLQAADAPSAVAALD